MLLRGPRHFEIAGSVTEVELKKLTFIGATDVSVGAFDLSNASATFDGRERNGQNTGKVSVLVYNGDRNTDSEGNLLPF
eukprot:5371444-Ditylum_brightwellii.AAC.1